MICNEEMGCYRKNQFVAQQIQKVISKVRKEIRKLSCTCMFSLLYYCLQENSFGIGSKSFALYHEINSLTILSARPLFIQFIQSQGLTIQYYVSF